MISALLSRDSVASVLCLGAHCDDIEIGCGGTLLQMADRWPDAHLEYVVFSSDAKREQEARSACTRIAANFAQSELTFHTFRNAYFPTQLAQIKDAFEALGKRVNPDIVLTHYRDDRHQDHRVISDLTWNTFRDHLILEYEIPKYDGDMGRPDTYVELTTGQAKAKVDCICESFASQQDHHWFRPETFRALMTLRGIECNADSRFAEAFYARKTRLNFV